MLALAGRDDVVEVAPDDDAGADLSSMEPQDMPQSRRAWDQVGNPSDSRSSGRSAGAERRARQRADLLSDSPAAKVQRMLVLAERFRALVALKSDPLRLVDLLRHIISLARETFGTDPSLDWAARTVLRMVPEQKHCVRDLEHVLQRLVHGAPDAWRDLGHAMDALLIQCMLFEAPTGQEATLADS
jgi:hypothetical protein